jgi:hypothetical protein
MFAGKSLKCGLLLPSILNLKEYELGERNQEDYWDYPINRENSLCYIDIEEYVSFVEAFTKFEDALIETNGHQEDIVDEQWNNEGEVVGEVATTDASV